MAVEFGAAIFGTIVNCVFKSAGLKFSYVRKYDDNIAALGSQLETLEKRENDVHKAIGVAEKKGLVILETVQHWKTRVANVKMKATNFLKDEVEVNKTRVKGWFPDLKTRYSLSKEAMEKHKEIKELREEQAQFGLNVSESARPPRMDSITSKDFVHFQTTKLAMEEVMAALRDDSTNFVGIHGMGGVGKTTLVKEIARKCNEEKLFDYVGIATVSHSQTEGVEQVKRIQGELADFLGFKLEEKGIDARAIRLYEVLKSEKKVLVILDDVWAKLDLTAIGIPSGEDQKGCKVVITTRRRQVCTAMADTKFQATRIVSLDVLNEQESWHLFKKQVGDIIDSPMVKIEAEKVVKECGGLPIALVTVGNAMRGKDSQEWKVAALELRKSRPTNIEGMEKIVFKCIRSSYDYLENEEEKAYFLLCCFFPEDCDIEIERLVRYGVVLNTFMKTSKIHEARRRVHSTINNLKSSSLLMASERDGCIKMHDVVRDVAKTISTGKYFVNDDEVLKEWPNDEYNGVGVSLMINEIQNYPDAWECPKLEIFLTHDYNVEQEMPEQVFKGMKNLIVLDQIHYSYYDGRSLEPSLSHLTNLQTLIIEGRYGQMWIQGISALRELKKLQVVSFRNCIFGESLDALRKLKKLRLLDLESCVNCSSLFNYTRTLAEDWNSSQLQELHVSEPMSCSVAEVINCHPRLNVLWFCIDDISWIPENFDLPNLDHFAINVGSYRHDFAGGYLENILHLDGKYGRLDSATPNRIGKLLPGVSILSLHRFKGFENILPYLLVGKDSLPLSEKSEWKSLKVKKLEVKGCHELKFLIDTQNKIPQPTYLEEVRLWNLQSFRGLCGMVLADIADSFSGLKELYIQSCPEMSNIGVPFNLLRRMRQLEVLQVYDCKAIEFLFDLKEEVEDAAEKEEEEILVNLRRITLDSLYNLEQLWKGPIGLVHLCNVKTVYISKCPKLRVLFHWSVAQRLEQLEELKVVSCYELQEILGRETGEVATGLEPFRSLKKVEIRGCPKLRVVFHWSFAQRLEQLEELKVVDCKELEEIVGRETGEEAVHKVLFPELQHLYIEELPKLVGFYTGNLPRSQRTPKLKTVRMPGVETLIEPEVKIAVGDRNLDTVIKQHKVLLR